MLLTYDVLWTSRISFKRVQRSFVFENISKFLCRIFIWKRHYFSSCFDIVSFLWCCSLLLLLVSLLFLLLVLLLVSFLFFYYPFIIIIFYVYFYITCFIILFLDYLLFSLLLKLLFKRLGFLVFTIPSRNLSVRRLFFRMRQFFQILMESQ